MCPIEAESRVWDSPLAAFLHIKNTEDDAHGEEGELTDDDPKFPVPTQKEPTEQTLEDHIDGSGAFPGQISEIVSALEEQGFESPPMLSEQDLETFRMLDMNKGIQNDIQVLQDHLEYYDRMFSTLLQNWDTITESGGRIVEPEPDEEDEEEQEEEEDNDQPSGRYTTADVMDREEEEVFGVLNRSTLLDDYSDDLFETFQFAYEEREGNGVIINDVSDSIGIPESLAEQNLEELDEMNLLRYDDDSDRYYIPY